MLVLSRKEGERVVIGGNVVITINRIAGNRITLAIDAPRDVRIVRGELTSFDSPADASLSETARKSEIAQTQCASAVPFELELDASLGMALGLERVAS
jgi:carbon storage regulator